MVKPPAPVMGVEIKDVMGELTTRDRPPQLGTEAGDEVDAAHGRPWLAQAGHRLDHRRAFHPTRRSPGR
jgi:hypothetical protein